MNGKNIEIFKLDGYNADSVYHRFNELTGLSLEFEIDQSYGTDCYGMDRFSKNSYPTLEELEEKIENFKNDEFKDYIRLDDIINYFRRKGELPETDILFEVSY